MDVILNHWFLNHLLGIIYIVAALGFVRLIHHTNSATPTQYSLILSKKSHLLGIFYAITATCLTVAYQNLFQDFSPMLLVWRLCLISVIAFSTWSWSCLAKRVRRVANV